MHEEKVINRLKGIINKNLNNKNYETALAACSVCAEIMYMHNQTYVDEELEIFLQQIGNQIIKVNKQNEITKPLASHRTILFYDGFGLDTRGLALIFVKALVEIGYQVVYVTTEKAKENQPRIHEVTKGTNIKWIYIHMDQGYLSWINELNSLFEKFKPETAFFYTTPNDVAATVVFDSYAGQVKRYQIDLTDHAFWLGKYSFDYCIALRDLGAKIEFNYRKIPKEKIVMLPYYATVNYDEPFAGFPFSTEGKRVIFSGGSLYKTLGDKEKKYYKIVESILEKHEDIIFMYAGSGDDSQLNILKQKYNDRVFHVEERKDLYQVLKHCVLYLNTYPMFGGLMMNYAATAGKIPITLKHNHDADGLLFNQSKLKIEYEDMDTLLQDVDKLLENPEYLKEREALLNGSVITEEKFRRELEELIENQSTSYEFEVDYVDTSEFREEFDKRFDIYKNVSIALYRKNNKKLVKNFLGMYWIGKFKCIKENLRKR